MKEGYVIFVFIGHEVHSHILGFVFIAFLFHFMYLKRGQYIIG